MIRMSLPPARKGHAVGRFGGGSPRPRVAVEVTSTTGPLGFLAHHNVLVIADCQNINMGARRLGLAVDWGRLARKLAQAARSVSRHAFICQPAGMTRQAAYYTRSGWTPHSKVSRTVQSWQGTARKTNTDHMIAFFAGVLASRSRATLVLVASGDGDLVEDLSEALSLLRRPRPIATLSIAGSTSQRLDALCSPFVVENVELGMDCLNHRAPKTGRLKFAGFEQPR